MNLKVFGKIADELTNQQIKDISESPAMEGQNIAIMPDNHFGKGACVGFTATFNDKIIPNIVGVDIGCGMAMLKLPELKENVNKNEFFEMLNRVIEENIPHGFNVRKEPERYLNVNELKDFIGKLKTPLTEQQKDHIIKSIGTLGGGNHFIEVGEAQNDDLYLIVHTGSRQLGTLVASHHQKIAAGNFTKTKPSQEEIMAVEPTKRQQFVADYVKNAKANMPKKDLEYLIGSQVDDYLNDMKIAQEYARANRAHIIFAIFEEIVGTDLAINYILENSIQHTVHNFVDTENKIIRKGAIFADPNNDIVIPLNMRDGCIIARGKSNDDANFSAPHGAGRVMSRTEAKKNISLDEFKKSMEGISSWTVNNSTIDEAPQAYKSKDEILEGVNDLIEVKEILKTVYNFKSSQVIDNKE